MLDGFLSTQASTVYVRLMLAPEDAADDERLFPEAVAELRRLGLVFRAPGPHRRLVAAAPPQAFDQLLALTQREAKAAIAGIERLLADLDQLAGGQHLRGPMSAGGPPIEVLEDATDIRCAAQRLRAEAGEDYLALVGGAWPGQPPLGWPPEPGGPERMDRPLAIRVVCQSAAVPETAYAHSRVVPDVPVDARIVDGRLALVALPDVPVPALMIRSAQIAGLLRRWFDLLWSRGTPVGCTDTAMLPYQRRVLTLMAAGHRDAHIARLTGTSTRTVRRHIAATMSQLGVSTRFEAGVAAHRRGWLGSPAARDTG